ncbi:histidine phosphatase superfamily [Dichotomocladium elegans]|nr:histidine phosphatase superfamily [Dichotomocladium elegans]
MAPSRVNVAFIVRHGERLDHVSRIWEPDPAHGLHDPPLSDKGYAQAERTGSYLVDLMHESGINPDTAAIVIYTSPFQRCIDTAITMAQHFPPRNTVLRLEIGLGEWMSDEFFSEPPCPASRLMERHHEALARRQLASYKSGTPMLQVDYGHKSSCTDFMIPQN